MSNHDNAQPRELTADEIAAIRTLADAAEQTMVRRQMALNNWSANPNQITEYALDFLSDNVVLSADGLVNAIRALLAHVAAVDARCRAYEAALRVIANATNMIDHAERMGVQLSEYGQAHPAVTMREIAEHGLQQAAATDGSGRDGNGEAG